MNPELQTPQCVFTKEIHKLTTQRGRISGRISGMNVLLNTVEETVVQII